MNALQICQSRWDNMAPPEPDEIPQQTIDSALDDARDEFLTDTFATSMWLCDNLKQAEGDSTFTDGFWHLDMSNATIDQLWALILTGSNDQCLHARMELRDRMCKSSAADIKARADALLRNAPEPDGDDANLWF